MGHGNRGLDSAPVNAGAFIRSFTVDQIPDPGACWVLEGNKQNCIHAISTKLWLHWLYNKCGNELP